MLRRAAASLFVLTVPKAVSAAETQLMAVLPALTLPPLAQPPLANFLGFSEVPQELKWVGSLAFGPRKDLGGRSLPPAAYDDRRMVCGKYCVPTFEMEKGAVVARSVLFGVGAASIGTGLAFAVVPMSEELKELAPRFRFSMGKQRVSMSATWSF